MNICYANSSRHGKIDLVLSPEFQKCNTETKKRILNNLVTELQECLDDVDRSEYQRDKMKRFSEIIEQRA